MNFQPYQDELETINRIHKFNPSDYTFIRLTKTMIDKNIIDANSFIRDLLLKYSIIDYSSMLFGGKNKKTLESRFIVNDKSISVKLNFYRATTRGDERFSISGIKRLVERKIINIGDLIYITINKSENPHQITLINVTKNIPNDNTLSLEFGDDAVEEALQRLIPLITKISKNGFHSNSKGPGKISPKDAGDTLEYLLGIKANNSKKADFENLIELKSKTSKSLDTLFTLRPHFENTLIAELEEIDRYRVSAFTRKYGYDSLKHEGYKSLYITIGSYQAPQNNHNFFLFVNEEERKIELRKIESGIEKTSAFWTFEELKKELEQKHPATLWVKAQTRMNGEIGEFNYTEVSLTRSPQFMTFISLVKSGIITYDWRGYTTPTGKYSGKNHGNAWRIKNKKRHLLFGSTETISLK
ncbi:hypothetical protein UC317_0468 [Lactococcus lactis subsp. lactis]|uniref:MvaI/BcnI family restriction endonuclease n=1 Tax=Lactococcus lactis TaxID=1358 RepID=UPI00071D9ED5|nr:MvaI/BcnI family restriction endonuclease [Lactococcus lactis]ARE09987.1 MvaI/BcnI family restriction endonuclease [Lactococcus lactis subsp. lactis]KSU33574.1 hypothetical protein UC317_0468 [Lactococcus lactis subsp. lactis]URL09036.1 MvaI/BcnI family restriction endonuclease [Lactococcus lactis subsp. lactis]